MKDNIEPIQQESDACEIKTPDDHRRMFRALENPQRRKIVKSIGASGKTKIEIMNELKISESQLKFQLDFLIQECYAQIDGDKFKLNSRGLQELLANIK
ncbi:MAG: hypothetical protein C3F06_11005 [Candidatus Methanoperedenaceae archaeon]|nr:MAG: hypothetical protein C3F06_11005 [Candidatus Methanoperedenaceae archaeon]